ncbi:MAG: radical SAM protein [Vicinamibacterales bacterium]|nr:radical SAM protein [Vicinamibacterales bacterium]
MVLHARHRGSSYVISLKSHSVAVGIDDRIVAAWDRGGRLYSLFRDDRTWRRGLSGRAIEKGRSGSARRRRTLTEGEVDELVGETAALAGRTSAAMATPDWRWGDVVDAVTAQEARVLLAFCARFDAAAARADAARFARVYRPVGILPPDQYLALVVQATEGCSFNTCTFCDLYHDPYRVKTQDEFREHVRTVLDYLGESVDLRSRGIFLGSANALAIPMTRLVPLLEVLAEEADSMRRGLNAFVDGFTGQLKTADDYSQLSQFGLRRVYVGLESGHDPLLAFVRKPGSAEGAVETVRAVKGAGLNVGVIVMTGLGGQQFADGHAAGTASALSAMALGPGDLVYFSELVEVVGTPYPRLALEGALIPLDHEACSLQRERILEATRFPGPPPQVATYDIREFVY